MLIPNEEFLISKVFMITFDLLAAWGKSPGCLFFAPIPHDFHCTLLAPARPADR